MYGKQAYCSDCFTIYANIKSCCIPESNTKLYANYISKKVFSPKLKQANRNPSGFLGHDLSHHLSSGFLMHLPLGFCDSGDHRKVGLEGVGDTEKGEPCVMAPGKGWEME